MEPRTVAASRSPNGNLEAAVEQDDRCAYLHLRELGEPSFELLGLRSCWVRNLGPAPPLLRVAELRQGLAPMMPAASCAHPDGAAPLSADSVRIVWLEEGDGVALVEGDSVLAIMPCWSGREGFHGYARDCTEESPVAWPLAPDSPLLARVRAAEEYWRTWDDGDPGALVQEAGLGAMSAAFGAPTHTYVIDAGEWPPQILVRRARRSPAGPPERRRRAQPPDAGTAAALLRNPCPAGGMRRGAPSASRFHGPPPSTLANQSL
ncbi:MAG TPA: hypothetical protein VFL83_05860 [Anaeromyxobacter sp.]|nr:hypothetical protein [Anaeromyxobacter sp.]